MDVTEEQVQRTFMERLEDYTDRELLDAVALVVQRALDLEKPVPVAMVAAWQVMICEVGQRHSMADPLRIREVHALMRGVFDGTVPIGDPAP